VDPFLILRHDIDVKDTGIRQILSIEENLGISASWYFRWEPADKAIIQEIKNAGGEVGLHYETLATLCRKRNIRSREEVSDKIVLEANHILKGEIAAFRKAYAVDCLTVASHGHPLNREIQMSNNEIVSPGFYSDAEILAEAYDQDLLARIDCYISDDTILRNHGWAYRISVMEAIEKGHRTIYFLSHPHHWVYGWKRRMRFIAQWVKRGVHVEKRTFKSRFQ